MTSLALHRPRTTINFLQVLFRFASSALINIHGHQVTFEENDARDPMNFSYKTKWTITLVACAFTGIVGNAIYAMERSESWQNLAPIAAAAASYSMGYQSMMRDLNCTQFQATVGLSLWSIGFGTVPLITSSFTEEFGRLNIYIVSSFGFMLTEMMIAL